MGVLGLIMIGLGIYGLFYGFSNPHGSGAGAKRRHDVQWLVWWIVALVCLPVGCAILEAVGRS